jgi:hypothetical protein
VTRRLAPLAAAILVVAFWATAAAPADGATEGGSAGFVAGLGVQHGYRISLSTRGRQVQVEIVKDDAYHHGGQFVAIYSVRGQVSPDALRANLGPFGKIDARFDETSRVGGVPQSYGTCRYRTALILGGRLRGTIRLRGEGGFLRFATHSTRAHYRRYFPEENCEAVHGGSSTEGGEETSARVATASGSEGFYEAIVISYGHDGRRRTFFEDESPYDVGDDGSEATGEGSSLDAGFRERRGRVEVLEHAFFDAPARFDLAEFDAGHVRATLAPPAPFSGTATFTRDGKDATATLTGPLTISSSARRTSRSPVPATSSTSAPKKLNSAATSSIRTERSESRRLPGRAQPSGRAMTWCDSRLSTVTVDSPRMINCSS